MTSGIQDRIDYHNVTLMFQKEIRKLAINATLTSVSNMKKPGLIVTKMMEDIKNSIKNKRKMVLDCLELLRIKEMHI